MKDSTNLYKKHKHNTHTQGERGGEGDRQTSRQIHSYTYTERDSQRKTERFLERDTHTQREREIQRQRQRDIEVSHIKRQFCHRW